MDIREFQDKLSNLVALAARQDHSLTPEQMRESFAGDDLEKEQMLRILQYLQGRGIRIVTEEPLDVLADDGIDLSVGTPAALSEEDTAYLRELLEELRQMQAEEELHPEWFEALSGKESAAMLSLSQYYMPWTAQKAAEMNCEEVLLADLIQEGNMALVSALSGFPEEKIAVENADAWIKARITSGLRSAIEEQVMQKQRDDSLVAKVEKLDSAVRELSEDEEDKTLPFTLQELAVILDMDEEEIRGILRLTGDEE